MLPAGGARELVVPALGAERVVLQAIGPAVERLTDDELEQTT